MFLKLYVHFPQINMDSDTSKSEAAQRIWAMLDDMAENDPVAYKKFLDKQMSDGKKYMAQPEPHMCVKTTIMVCCM